MLIKAFWFYGRFSEAMSFSKFALLNSKVTIYIPKIVHCLASPGKVSALALWSAASMNKEKHNFAALQSGGVTQWNSSLLRTSSFDTKGANFENDIASEKWLWNQNAFIKIINLGVILLEKECSTHSCTRWLDLVPDFFEISDRKCCILSGPPCKL